MSYIVPSKFPTSCCGCHMFKQEEHDLWCVANHYAGYCRVLSKYIDENKFVIERHPDCPLIEVPTPHGELVDRGVLMDIYADRLTAVAERYSPDSSECGILSGAMKLLAIMPTVIEAEGEDNA